MIPSTNEQKLQWKQRLKEACINILQQRIVAAEQAMNEAQDAANSEGKSSAGDKYETSRAMGQLDRDMNAKQLETAKHELAFIHSLPVDVLHNRVAMGTVVVCKDPLFFISLGLGTATFENHSIILLSNHSPVAQLMNNKKAGDTFAFNGKANEILNVF